MQSRDARRGFTVSRRFEGRVAIVTGAAKGIGRAIAERFLDEGAAVAVADVLGNTLHDTANELAARGGRVIHDAGDLSQPGVADRLVARTLAELGGLDVLVNNAGGGVIRPYLAHTEETMRATLDRNLVSTIRMTTAALPKLIERGYGRIVMIGAESVRNGLWMHAMYNAAKGGVHGLTTGLAREVIGHGITVNCVAPSAVMTDEVRVMLAEPDKLPPEWQDFWKRCLASIPAGRPAEVDEVVATVAFMASAEASFITGQVVSVNGGSSML
jgi:2,3-dihydroxy-2,3-dihydro-p-cumate dehydrogenase